MRISDWSSDVCSSDLAIAWAWELLTEVWKLPPERMLVTIYHSDDEAFDLWHTMIGLPAERIIRIGTHKRDRKSVVSGKSVSVRVALGGRRIIRTKTSDDRECQTRQYSTTIREYK